MFSLLALVYIVADFCGAVAAIYSVGSTSLFMKLYGLCSVLCLVLTDVWYRYSKMWVVRSGILGIY